MLVFLGCVNTTVCAVEVILHPSVSEKQLSTAQLRRIYTMRQIQWADGQRITVYMLPRQHELHLLFSKERLQMFPYQLDRIWNKLTYSGLGVAPITVSTPELLFQSVKTTPGAIGYVKNSQGMEGLNVVKITN